MSSGLKPVIWIGSSKKDLKVFPPAVRKDIGKALYAAQKGKSDPAAKPLRGFGGRQVLEIVERYRTDAYRAVYTVQFTDAIYVLHAFQKKAKRGISTPKRDIDLVRRRLREADQHHRERRN